MKEIKAIYFVPLEAWPTLQEYHFVLKNYSTSLHESFPLLIQLFTGRSWCLSENSHLCGSPELSHITLILDLNIGKNPVFDLLVNDVNSLLIC